MKGAALTVDLHVLLNRGNTVLMLVRKNTGYRDGDFGLPSGHLESDERAITGAARELLEEIGISANEADLNFELFLHHRSNNDRAALFFSLHHWNDEPVNREPHKCARLAWVDQDNPPENVVPYIKFALQCIKKGLRYADFGWDA